MADNNSHLQTCWIQVLRPRPAKGIMSGSVLLRPRATDASNLVFQAEKIYLNANR